MLNLYLAPSDQLVPHHLRLQSKNINIAAYIYLALPAIVFFVGWFNFSAGFLSLIFTFFPIIYYFYKYVIQKKACKNHESININISYKDLFLSLTVICCIIMFSGVAAPFGFGGQTHDYPKHNAILHDLIEKKWPVYYQNQTDNPSGLLIYYLGYYLPAAIIGKLFSFSAAMAFQTIWNIIGLLIMALFLFRLIGKSKWQYLFAFFFIRGASIFGKILFTGFPLENRHFERYLPNLPLLDYNGPIMTLFWAPQHAIPAFIATLLILSQIESRQNTYLVCLPFCLLWSPFIFIGLLPYALYGFIQSIRQRFFSWFYCIYAILLSMLIGLYYLVNTGQGTFSFLITPSVFIRYWPQIIIFALLEFGLYGIIMGKFITNKSALLIAFLILIVMMVPCYGQFNDLALRATVPALCVLSIYIIRFLEQNPKAQIKKNLLYILIGIGLFCDMFSIMQSIENNGVVRDLSSIEEVGSLSFQYIAYDYNTNPWYKFILKH